MSFPSEDVWRFDFKPGWSYYQKRMTNTLLTVSFKLPASDLRRIPSRNRSKFFRAAVQEKLSRLANPAFAPKTDTARRMLALRRKFEAEGGELLDAAGIADEMRARRGGLA
jgi:hypothetical protein